jgi:voltage-gated potassium channel
MTQKELTRNNILLLTCLLIFILLFPVMSIHRVLFKDVILSLMVIAGIFALDFSEKAKKNLIVFGGATVLIIWSDHFITYEPLRIVAFLIIFLFIFFIVAAMISYIARSKNVTLVIIISSVNGYLFLGVLGALLLRLTEIFQKFIFKNDTLAIDFAGNAVQGFHDYIYFSFVTLTTLGYGDVTPASSLAKSVTVLIAIAGQLYLTILIALIVGKFLSKK